MFKLLFGVIGIGIVIMTCLFFYWLKYVYVEKDYKDRRSIYSPLSQNSDENNNNDTTLFKVDKKFINKKNEYKYKNKKA